MMRRLLYLVPAALVLLVVGSLIGMQASGAVDDPCRDALVTVVAAVETQWSTASEALSQGQQAAQHPTVGECLAD